MSLTRRLSVFGALVVVVASGCTSDPQDRGAHEPTQSAPASTTTKARPHPKSTPKDELNKVEKRITTALASLGVPAQPAEHSVNNAVMWAQLGAGRELYVNGTNKDIPEPEFTIVSERVINSITVRLIKYESGSKRDMFVCSDIRYEVSGDLPPKYAERDTFLGDFIDALDCGS